MKGYKFKDGYWYKVSYKSDLIKFAYSTFNYEVYDTPSEILTKLEYEWWEGKQTECLHCYKKIELKRPMEIECYRVPMSGNYMKFECPKCHEENIIKQSSLS